MPALGAGGSCGNEGEEAGPRRPDSDVRGRSEPGTGPLPRRRDGESPGPKGRLGEQGVAEEAQGLGCGGAVGSVGAV